MSNEEIRAELARHFPEVTAQELESLDAIAKIEARLTEEQWGPYCIALNKIACRLECGNTHTCGYTIAASATQRATALLEVIRAMKK